MDPPPSSGGTDNTFISSLNALHSSSGDEYHLVHISHDDLTDMHSANSPASTPPPIVMNRKRSSPTGSNSSRELEDSPGTAASTGKYFPLHLTVCAAAKSFSLVVSRDCQIVSLLSNPNVIYTLVTRV